MSTVTIPDSGPWTLGTMIGLPILILVTAGAIYGTVKAYRWARKEARGVGDVTIGDRSAYFFPGIGAVVSLFLIGATTFSAVPLDTDYHQYRHVSGKVERVESRMIADGKAMSQRFVVVIDGRPFAVDDTRAALLKPGDSVDLSCTREWVYASESGWACNWGAPS